ncbi:MAG TPA: ABC transporter permease [Longimicrobium sp.]|jgi:putative ABC transport system permease protein|uniref:ABC transporter permease n=1 Tax=Longimicrobium sp. TaxID=2029185 RepID=UPI002ED7EC06
MHWIADLPRRVRTLWRRDVYETDLHAEVEFHLEMLRMEFMRSGMSAQEARRQAFITFGGVERFKDECRDARGLGKLEDVIHDTRYALSAFRRAPGFAAAAVLLVALGIGASVGVFSAVSALLLRPLPYHSPDRIVVLGEAPVAGASTRPVTSYDNSVEWKARARSFAALAVVDEWSPTLSGTRPAERVSGALVTADLFGVLRVHPAIGRALVPSDHLPASERVIVLGHAFWQRRFGADSSIVGRRVTLNGASFRVVGVLPPGFRGPAELGGDLWGSFVRHPHETRDSRSLRVFARLREGVGVAAAREELARVSATLAREYPENRGMKAVLTPLRRELARDSEKPLILLGAMTSLVVLVACCSVSNLLLARGAARQREIAVRAALGATRGRIVRQLLTESGLLCLAGAAAGLGLGMVAVRATGWLGPRELRAAAIGLDTRVVLCAVSLSLVLGLTAGILPALAATRRDLHAVLLPGARGSTAPRGRLRHALAGAQLAGALALVSCGALLFKSFARVQANDPGVGARGVLAFSVSLPESRYPDTLVAAAGAEIVSRVRALPGVTAVAATSLVPFSGEWDRVGVEVEGWAGPGDVLPEVDRFVVSPDYFATLAIRRIRGRVFGPLDGASAPRVAVVDERFAERVTAGRLPIGRRVRLPGDSSWATIVGVVGHVRHYGRDVDGGGQIYFAQAQYPRRWLGILARTDGGPRSILGPARTAVARVDPELAVYGARTLAGLIAEQGASRRLATVLVGVYAAITAVIAIVGVYAVVSHEAAQRTREFAVRLALGASPREIVISSMRTGMVLTAAGVAAGLVLAHAATRAFSAHLYGVRANDPVLLAAVALLVGAAALLASYLPARRAAYSDPVMWLKE